jgi:hypothetical protein
MVVLMRGTLARGHARRSRTLAPGLVVLALCLAATAAAPASVGMDVLLFSNKNVGEGDQGLGSLTTALRPGRLPRPAFEASVRRILALRAALGHRGPLAAP